MTFHILIDRNKCNRCRVETIDKSIEFHRIDFEFSFHNDFINILIETHSSDCIMT